MAIAVVVEAALVLASRVAPSGADGATRLMKTMWPR
jgi:hypothetical protein